MSALETNLFMNEKNWSTILLKSLSGLLLLWQKREEKGHIKKITKIFHYSAHFCGWRFNDGLLICSVTDFLSVLRILSTRSANSATWATNTFSERYSVATWCTDATTSRDAGVGAAAAASTDAADVASARTSSTRGAILPWNKYYQSSKEHFISF